MIPKVIHYCWFSDDVMPAQYQICIDSWTKYCPDYKIKCWHDISEIANKVPFVKTALDNKLWAFAADYVRFYALYHFGGIYLDCDVELMGCLDKYLDNRAFVGSEVSLILQICKYVAPELAIMGAQPNEPIFKELLQIYETKDWGDWVSDQYPPIIGGVTLPIFLAHGYEQVDKEQMLEGGTHVYPSSVFTNRGYNQPSAVAVHHYESAWKSHFNNNAKIDKYDLVIAHRVYPSMPKVAPELFSDKLEMVKICSQSLLKSVEYSRSKGRMIKVVIILDGCPPEYKKFYQALFCDIDIDIVSVDKLGNQGTFMAQIRILEKESAKNVYFSEDDYYYKPEALEAMMDFLSNKKVDFVTPLDHPDRYIGAVEPIAKSSVMISRYCHWRDVENSCCTFMTSRETLSEAKRGLKVYPKGFGDGVMWMVLTKKRVFSPLAIAKALINRMGKGRNRHQGTLLPYICWRYCGLRMLTTRKFSLWQPMPSLAVHFAVASLPSNTIDILKDYSDDLATLDEIVWNYLEIKTSKG